MIATETKTLRWQTIYLARDEWDTGTLMDDIADRRFLREADPHSLVLTIYEHAGWFMEYGWDGALVRLGSANCANRSPRAEAYRESMRGARNEIIPGFYR